MLFATVHPLCFVKHSDAAAINKEQNDQCHRQLDQNLN